MHEARKISANSLFGQKELSQGNKIQTVGPSLQAAGSGVVCFGLARAARVNANETRKITANFSFGQKELSQGNKMQDTGPGMVCFRLDCIA